MAKIDFFLLPDDLWPQIFRELDLISLGRLSTVNKVLQFWINAREALWKESMLQVPHFQASYLHGQKKGYHLEVTEKKFLKDQHLASFKILQSRLQRFVEKIQFNEKGYFQCIFPFNPACRIAIWFDAQLYGRDIYSSKTREENFYYINDNLSSKVIEKSRLSGSMAPKIWTLSMMKKAMNYSFEIHLPKEDRESETFILLSTQILEDRLLRLKGGLEQKRDLVDGVLIVALVVSAVYLMLWISCFH